jgi:hypothetical protein
VRSVERKEKENSPLFLEKSDKEIMLMLTI